MICRSKWISEKLDNNLFTRKILPVLKSVDVSKLQELPDDLREKIMKNESINIDSLPTADKVKIYNAFNNIKQETHSFGGQLSDAGKDVITTISNTGKSYYNRFPYSATLSSNWKNEDGSYKTFDIPGHGQMTGPEAKKLFNELGGGSTPEGVFVYNKKYDVGGKGYSKKDEHGNFVYPTVTLEDGTEVPAQSGLTGIDDPTMVGNVPGTTPEGHHTRLYEIDSKTGEKKFVQKSRAVSHPIPKNVEAVRNEAVNNPDIANNLSAGCMQRGDCEQTELIQWVHNPSTEMDTIVILNSLKNPKDGLLLKQHLKEIDEGEHTKKQRKTIVERVLALLN